MRRISLEIGPVDLREAEAIEVCIAKHEDGYRVWVNSEEGNILRAYRVKECHLQLDGASKAALGWEECTPGYSD